MTKRAKSRPLRALPMKNDLGLKRMLIVIIFLVTNRGLARVLWTFFIGPSSIARETKGRRKRVPKESTIYLEREEKREEAFLSLSPSF